MVRSMVTVLAANHNIAPRLVAEPGPTSLGPACSDGRPGTAGNGEDAGPMGARQESQERASRGCRVFLALHTGRLDCRSNRANPGYELLLGPADRRSRHLAPRNRPRATPRPLNLISPISSPPHGWRRNL